MLPFFYFCSMSDNNIKRTELSDLGEFGLIRKLTESFTVGHPQTLEGVGDDAAVLDALGKKVLVTTDLLVEGVHFDLTFMPLRHLGYKAVVVNLSDIAAMNGTPAQITVSIAVSNRFSVEALEEVYEGIRLACEKYRVDLVGGDTTTSLSGLLISVTAVGYADVEDIVYRSTAKENDLICVTGDLGGAYAGLLLLEREKAVFKANPEIQPDLEGHDYVLQRQIKPEARFDILEELRKKNIKPTAMIDISDGLASEILHICSDSNMGAAIYAEKIPLDPGTIALAETFKIEPYICALNGGEDYELLFTVRPVDYETVHAIPGISIIGHITEPLQGVNLISSAGSQVAITAQGWDSFRNHN
jgi:thiamine-monophosphate kinase